MRPRRGTIYTDVEVEIDVEDVLSELDIDDVIDYFGKDELLKNIVRGRSVNSTLELSGYHIKNRLFDILERISNNTIALTLEDLDKLEYFANKGLYENS